MMLPHMYTISVSVLNITLIYTYTYIYINSLTQVNTMPWDIIHRSRASPRTFESSTPATAAVGSTQSLLHQYNNDPTQMVNGGVAQTDKGESRSSSHDHEHMNDYYSSDRSGVDASSINRSSSSSSDTEVDYKQMMDYLNQNNKENTADKHVGDNISENISPYYENLVNNKSPYLTDINRSSGSSSGNSNGSGSGINVLYIDSQPSLPSITVLKTDMDTTRLTTSPTPLLPTHITPYPLATVGGTTVVQSPSQPVSSDMHADTGVAITTTTTTTAPMTSVLPGPPLQIPVSTTNPTTHYTGDGLLIPTPHTTTPTTTTPTTPPPTTPPATTPPTTTTTSTIVSAGERIKNNTLAFILAFFLLVLILIAVIGDKLTQHNEYNDIRIGKRHYDYDDDDDEDGEYSPSSKKDKRYHRKQRRGSAGEQDYECIPLDDLSKRSHSRDHIRYSDGSTHGHNREQGQYSGVHGGGSSDVFASTSTGIGTGTGGSLKLSRVYTYDTPFIQHMATFTAATTTTTAATSATAIHDGTSKHKKKSRKQDKQDKHAYREQHSYQESPSFDGMESIRI